MKFKSGEFIFKEIKKKDFQGDWPFISDTALVGCMKNIFCIVQLNGKTYALNGIAASKFNLKTPHQKGKAVIGKSIAPFIKMAKELSE